MDKEMLEQFQMILQGMADMEGRLNKQIQQTKEEMRQEIKQSETRTQIYMENSVTKKIEALFDGYKLTHEKQWEMQRELDEIKRRLDALENRTA